MTENDKEMQNCVSVMYMSYTGANVCINVKIKTYK